MSSSTQVSKALIAALNAMAAVAVIGCSDGASGSGAATTASATAAPAATTAAATATAAAPSATASATAAVPAHDCPKGSSGEGSLKAPCDAKGTARMMEVTWNGKIGDNGPSFRVHNTSPLTILYGKIAVYFYDKAGKQLEVKDDATPPKGKPNQPCFGNLFGGVMKPAEKAVVTFSCVQKKHVPEGTAFIEGELHTVGFADQSEKKSEFYWRNNDLIPDVRPKGGIKK